MINFTPPIKASLFTTLVYAICFQLFLESGNQVWLLPGNAFFIVCSVLYIQFLNRKAVVSMPVAIGKGTRLSFMSSLLCMSCAALIFFANFYLLSNSKHSHVFATDIEAAVVATFFNAFLVNFVCGGLSALITAALVNEKRYTVSSKHLPSVKR